jgi:5-methylcytosine-specific restriction enzyme subunit McrC
VISLRLSEWSSADVRYVPIEARRRLAAVVDAWLDTQPTGVEPPLTFSGPAGETLRAANHAGVIEVPGLRVEIFPKLDSTLVADNARVSAEAAARVLRNLAWMIEASNFEELPISPPAGSGEVPDCFMDWLAWLFADLLCRELTGGIHHAYVVENGRLGYVRGRLDFPEQIRHQGWRQDHLACSWDDLSPDTPLNRLFLAAVALLRRRTKFHAAICALAHCQELLSGVRECSPGEALQATRHLVLDRNGLRFDACVRMAKLLLGGGTLSPYANGAHSFVFLLDMNRLFEAFAGAALKHCFTPRVEEQPRIGHLLANPARRPQIADFVWRTPEAAWIADAKYKRISSLDNVDTADLRQLITYGLMAAPDQFRLLLVIYPSVGENGPPAQWRETFDGSRMISVPLFLDRPGRLDFGAIGHPQRSLS